MRSDAMGHQLLPKRIALPIFASDALSSVAYAPDEVLLTLALAGTMAALQSVWVGAVVALVLAIVVASYRQTVHAYPSGGGDYEVVTTNLGRSWGLLVASALLVDYILTVAVSISSGANYITTAVPALLGYEVPIAVGLVVVLATLNLRGTREAGGAFAIPTYVYMFAIGLMIVVGFAKLATGHLGVAPTAAYDLVVAPGHADGLAGLAGVFLLMRAFSSGCAALTGVEAISNGVPMFRNPKSKNAATTLAMLGLIAAISLLVGGIGVMNVMLMTVRERTREIGIRIATGARQADILRQFLVEAMLLTGIGGTVGVSGGLLIGLGLKALGIPMAFSPLAAAMAFGCAVATGMIFGFMPARQAARLDPVRALAGE